MTMWTASPTGIGGPSADEQARAERRDLGRERAARALAARGGLDLALPPGSFPELLAILDPVCSLVDGGGDLALVDPVGAVGLGVRREVASASSTVTSRSSSGRARTSVGEQMRRACWRPTTQGIRR